MDKYLKEALIASYNNGNEIAFIKQERLVTAHANADNEVYYNIYEYSDRGDWILKDGGSYDCDIETFIEDLLKEEI